MAISSSTLLPTPTKQVRHLEFTILTNKLLAGPTLSHHSILNSNTHTQVLTCRVPCLQLYLCTSNASPHHSSDAFPYSNLRLNWYKCQCLSFSYLFIKVLPLPADRLNSSPHPHLLKPSWVQIPPVPSCVTLGK